MSLPNRRRLAVALLVCAGVAGHATRGAAQAPNPTAPPPSQPPEVDTVEEPPQPPAAVPPPQAAAQPQAAETTAPAEQATSRPANLEEKVKATLAEAFPEIDERLKVETTPEGLVEVEGTVPLLADKLAISDKLTALPETAVVVNRTAPEAPRRSDAAITREVRRRLRAEEDLRDLEIAVRTENQRVFLSGRVPSFPAVDTALREAAAVRGVRDVVVSRLETSIPR